MNQKLDESLTKSVEAAYKQFEEENKADSEKSEEKTEAKEVDQPKGDEVKKEQETSKDEKVEEKEEVKESDKKEEKAESESEDKEPEEESKGNTEEDNRVNKADNKGNKDDNYVPLPRHLEKELEDKWAEVPKELKLKIIEKFEKNDKDFSRFKNKSAMLEEYENSLTNYKGYIRTVAKQANIKDAEVIGNIVSWAEGFSRDPDNSALEALTRQAPLKNAPVFIKKLAHLYNVDLAKLNEADSSVIEREDRLTRLEAQLEAQKAQAKYKAEYEAERTERDVEEAIEDFLVRHSDYNSQDLVLEAKMQGAINTIKILEPKLSYVEILEKAYSQVKGVVAPAVDKEAIRKEIEAELLSKQKQAADKAKQANVSLKSSSPSATSITKPKVWKDTRDMSDSIYKAVQSAMNE